MSIEIIEVFAILAITIILFVTEFFPVDKIAFFLIVSLTLFKLVEPEEAITGFANPATITVLCLMILAIGLEENGVIAWLSRGLRKMSVLPLLIITPAFMVITASISAFISTTAVVIIFIKIVFQLAERYDIQTSRLLMPISFAGILGGSCTLMGTSTNLIVNAVAQDLGVEKLGFFEFAPFGLAFLLIGIVYITIAARFLPKENPDQLEKAYKLDELVTTVEIGEESALVGQRIEKTFLYDNPDVSLIKLMRDDDVINAPGRYITLKPGDKLVVMCDFENLLRLSKEEDFIINETRNSDDKKKAIKDKQEVVADVNKKSEKSKKEEKKVIDQKTIYAELLMLPGSSLLGKTLKDLREYSLKGAIPLGIKKRRNIRNTKERLIRKDIDQIRLKPGDRVLVETSMRRVASLEAIENVAILQEHDFTPTASQVKKYGSLGILILVIALASTGVLSILSASLSGVALMLATNCLALDKVYKKVDWQIIFLLAGMIPLGLAMNNSGADVWISENLLALMEGKDAIFTLGVVFLVTMVMSGTVSNNATAIIMAPIAISIASGLDASPKPFILAVMFAANFSFFTPVGYQTNALIYGMGVYKFKHFLIIGGILSLLLLVAGTLMLSTMLT
ncbi:SLC13 family permease [Flavimarina sp. Hel_I_48]|uniref:SLC13 family permease n=1 Tax=Flavimarina sp. Hel_I_48 TaxID=1392488 RepID=UPI0004DF6C35|nr:SLC13 family permease [Flavimarina sp. Hel_I_48]